MSPLSMRFSIAAFAATTFASAALFGPPKITVRQVTDANASTAPAGAALLIDGEHHTETGHIGVVGRAEGLRNGQRVQQKLTINKMSNGHFSVSKQWQAGTAWVLVFAAEEGENGAHAVAEALVKVNADGKIVDVEYPKAGWVDKTNTPLRVSTKEIDAELAQLAKP